MDSFYVDAVLWDFRSSCLIAARNVSGMLVVPSAEEEPYEGNKQTWLRPCYRYYAEDHAYSPPMPALYWDDPFSRRRHKLPWPEMNGTNANFVFCARYFGVRSNFIQEIEFLQLSDLALRTIPRRVVSDFQVQFEYKCTEDTSDTLWHAASIQGTKGISFDPR